MRKQIVKTQSYDKKKKSPPEYDNFAVEMNHKKIWIIHKKKLPILNLHHPVLSFTCTLLSAWIANSWIEFFTYYVYRDSWWALQPEMTNDLKSYEWNVHWTTTTFIPLPAFKCIGYSKKTIIVDINTLSLFAAPAIKLNWN